MSQDQEMSAEEVERIQAEREERLTERPDNVEIDNTQRDFDPTKGMFTDSPGYDEAPAPFPDPVEEDPTAS